MIVTQNLKFVFERVENIVGKEKMLVTIGILSFSHIVFESFLSIPEALKVRITW